ncbi:helicase-related protein [Paenibacillus sp. 7541]|uniref:helicase-related protein n=1 Tax=Paenibacillus sp. 7541 TaxID=2026236 RepID=UPI000BA608F9|nr:helicase-related protein [Paenibacillus sp. 7541]PAK51967.1 DNA/RNA helicase [Paenibacillus sp. 7541]
MRVALYMLRNEEQWNCCLSLDLRVDIEWWLGSLRNNGKGTRMVVLSEHMPLGWAVAWRDHYTPLTGMDAWGETEWRRYMRGKLMSFVETEPPENRASWEALLHEVSLWGEFEQSSQKVRRTASHTLSASLPLGTNGAFAAARTLPAERQGRRESQGIDLDELMRRTELLCRRMVGRALLAGEVEGLLAEVAGDGGDWRPAAQLGCLLGRLRLEAGLGPDRPAPRGVPGWLRRRRAPALRCRRCGSVAESRTACAACGSAACAYCEACLAMGRSRACALLLQGTAGPAVRGTAGGSPTEALGRWGLSAAQSAAAGAALRFLAEPRAAGSAGAAQFLIWAVTGAGKTEMIFPLLQAVLDADGRVLVAAPRRDVVLELAPRLAKAFPSETVVTLYGGSPDRWKEGRITLATTHQLLRFRRAFDLVVIDEIDAFPYHNNPMLDYAATGAVKPGGKYILLSATPPARLQRQAAAGRLPHAKVPARFHGHPLPVPERMQMMTLAQCLQKQRLPSALLNRLRSSLGRGAQVFLFVSRIKHIEPMLRLLQQALPGTPVDGTSSVDPMRAEKVMSFRNRDIRVLVTTTILERGVTVPKSDVFIVDADSELFDEAALIQMAGRAGRSKDDPAGRVLFAASQWTRSQRLAVQQIKQMNRIASAGGYLRHGGS